MKQTHSMEKHNITDKIWAGMEKLTPLKQEPQIPLRVANTSNGYLFMKNSTCKRLVSYCRSLLIVSAATVFTGCDSGVVVESATTQTNITQTPNVVNDAASVGACIDSEKGIVVCPASDMARVTRTGPVPYEHSDLNWSNGPLQLHAARNETIAFQLILVTDDSFNSTNVSVELGSIKNTLENSSVNQNAFNQSFFSAYYHPIDNAGYTWGPDTPVLPWPDEYPDALIPTQHSCGLPITGNVPNITFQPKPKTNQALWIDTYVGKTTTAGTYSQNIVLSIGENKITLPIQITIYDTTLPDENSINAIGELYRTYFMEGAGFDMTQQQWRTMAHCYQQMAHKHRMVFIERIAKYLTAEQLEIYADTITPAMTGELFTSQKGYSGPGANTPVSLWRTPWPQTINDGAHSSITETDFNHFQQQSKLWHELAERRAWPKIDYFAYVFDEVDGPQVVGDDSLSRDQYLELIHDQMAVLQEAIDDGSESTNIDLLWTSHSNPAVWKGNPQLDLTGTIRLWAPNASAADVDFLQERMDAGEKAWFYHSGHPAIGAHSINVSGIEMRTWGVVGARYNFSGQLMWAVNLGSNDYPFRDPQYKPEEDRAGNGVMVYPGNQLDRIGYEKSPGPIPSMRLKAWRRGLQDAELYYLALDQSPDKADALIKNQIPRALTKGRDLASWSSNPADWIDFHRQLLELASGQ